MNLSRLNRFFSRCIEPLSRSYRASFSIEEIETQPILQWMFAASLFFFFVEFNKWISSTFLTVEGAQSGAATCWEWFQNCADYYFLHNVGIGYSQSTFYMALYGVILLIIYCMWQKKWTAAHALLMMLFLWEVLVILVLSFHEAAPYYYYHIALTAALLFVPHKEFFLKLTFVWMYFMSVTTKFDSTWVMGSYFTALRDGLPLFPDALASLVTNLVIFMQTVGCWFLISKNRLLQRLAFVYFLSFHLYSGVFVTYFYPSVTLPAVLVLFGPMYRYTKIPFDKKVWGGYFILLLLAIFQLIGFAVPGDRRMTLEGNKYGMFMFEANHQCIVTTGTYTKERGGWPDFESADGTQCPGFFCLVKRTVQKQKGGSWLREERWESGTAWNRCYPYEWWSKLQTRCEANPGIRISLKLDHSINGGPFYRIVDVPDICKVPYKAFGGNDWIQEPPQAPLIGYPVTNTYN